MEPLYDSQFKVRFLFFRTTGLKMTLDKIRHLVLH